MSDYLVNLARRSTGHASIVRAPRRPAMLPRAIRTPSPALSPQARHQSDPKAPQPVSTAKPPASQIVSVIVDPAGNRPAAIAPNVETAAQPPKTSEHAISSPRPEGPARPTSVAVQPQPTMPDPPSAAPPGQTPQPAALAVPRERISERIVPGEARAVNAPDTVEPSRSDTDTTRPPPPADLPPTSGPTARPPLTEVSVPQPVSLHIPIATLNELDRGHAAPHLHGSAVNQSVAPPRVTQTEERQFALASPARRDVHVRIGTIEIHSAPEQSAPPPLTASPPPPAAAPSGFDAFSHLRSYAPWER